MMRLYTVPASTNVERVALALAHKRLPFEYVRVPFDDRSGVRRVSGRGVLMDSMEPESDHPQLRARIARVDGRSRA